MRLRRALVIATLSLLTWTATASAECAWVLWSGKTGALRAEVTKELCETYHQKAPDLECLPDTPITATPSKCSWTLWTYVPMQTPAKTVFATNQECETARDDANRMIAKPGESAFVCGESDSPTPQPQHGSVWRLMRPGMTRSPIGTFKTYRECLQVGARSGERMAFCLPDTVDPRGPKGK